MHEWFDAEQRVERAQNFCETRQWSEALAEMDAALTMHPENAAWHAMRGYLLHVLGRESEAADAYEMALQVEPDDRDISMVLGIAMARLGRLARAADVLEELSAKHPDFTPAYCHRIYIYTELGMHERAEEIFYLAQQYDDACPHCFYHMGLSLAARSQTERAIYCWKHVLELEPDYSGVRLRLARGYRALGHNDEAKEHFLHEYRENPGNTDVILALADLDLVSAAKDQAMARFKQIIELDPTHSDALFGMGQLWLERNEAAKALEAFEAIYAIDDEQSIPTLSLRTGEALLKLGKYQQALTRFEAAARIQGDDQLVQLRLGECFFSMQRLPEAAACFRRVLNAESGNAAAHHNLGLCLLRMGRAAAGLEHCRRSLQLKPDSVAALRTTAAACLRLGRWKEAKSLLRHAQSIAPDDKIILSLISATWRYRLRHLLRRVLWPFRGPSRTIDRHA